MACRSDRESSSRYRPFRKPLPAPDDEQRQRGRGAGDAADRGRAEMPWKGFGALFEEVGSQKTHRRRKTDSNPRSPLGREVLERSKSRRGGSFFTGGLRVRIRLPPAASQANTVPAGSPNAVELR